MSYEEKKQKAVLVLPELGIPEEKLRAVGEEFQNTLVGTLERAGGVMDAVVVVVVVVVAG